MNYKVNWIDYLNDHNVEKHTTSRQKIVEKTVKSYQISLLSSLLEFILSLFKAIFRMVSGAAATAKSSPLVTYSRAAIKRIK
jgi:hypothetical protein